MTIMKKMYCFTGIAIYFIITASQVKSDSLINNGQNKGAIRAAAQFKEEKIAEKPDGTIEQRISMGKDGAHIAFLVEKEGKSFVVADGEQHPEYDFIDGVFACEGKFGYIAQKDKKQFVVLDGKIGKKYDRINNFSEYEKIIFFCNDGVMDAAYIGAIDEQERVVFAGKEGPVYFIITDLEVSPDNKRIAYVVRKNDKAFVVCDDIEQPAFNNIGESLVFSPDSERLSYIANDGKKEFVVLDGIPGKGYDYICSRNFSPDSRRFAYIAKKDDKYIVVVDGKESASYDEVSDVVWFSPDSKRWICEAKKDNLWHMIIDWKEEPGFEEIQFVGFDADNKPIYVGRKLRKYCIIADDKEIYPGSDALRAYISPDGRSFAYTAARKFWVVVVFNGKESSRYGSVEQLKFSPDGKRIGFITGCYPVEFVVVNDAGSPWYNRIHEFWLTNSYVAYIVEKDNKRFAVIDGKEGPAYTKIYNDTVKLSEDGILEYISEKDDVFYRVKQW